MFSNQLRKIQSISVKWKILIPFLFFAFIGTTSLVYMGLNSQQELIRKEEKKELNNYYRLLLSKMDQQKDQALSLAAMIAENKNTKMMLAQRDRDGLKEHFLPLHDRLKKDFGIKQFHFHIPPGKSFLRLHLPQEFGEKMPFRLTVMEVLRSKKPVGGLEWGWTGLGIRGVAPVIFQGKLAGTVEIGHPFEKKFCEQLKKDWGPDFTIYEIKGDHDYPLLATTQADLGDRFLTPERMGYLKDMDPLILIAPGSHPDHSILLGSLKDYYGQPVALVQIVVDRSPIVSRLSRARLLMVVVALAGILVSFSLTWLIASLIVRPIKEIVVEAQDIAAERRGSRLESRPNDEIGLLTNSLNDMLEALKERRKKIEEHAKFLEKRVQERTADLVSSEEKYRTLVENLPLIVYRVLDDGTTEFINPVFTEKLGYTVDEVVADPGFWSEKICGTENTAQDAILHTCFMDGEDLSVERKVKTKEGQTLIFVDHAMPLRNQKGDVLWIDGTMVDITEMKRLEDKTVRAEEMRVLGEISARFAHEIRNPLSTVGGFARRLEESFDEDDKRKKLAKIIVEEASRLEGILKIILSSIEPLSLCISEVNLTQILQSWIDEMHEQIESKRLKVVATLSASPMLLMGDESLLIRAFEALLTHAFISTPVTESIQITTSKEGDQLVVSLQHPMEGLAQEDLDQFFLPRFTSQAGPVPLELPLAKAIIHRHGGKIDVMEIEEDTIQIRIELPLGFSDASYEKDQCSFVG